MIAITQMHPTLKNLSLADARRLGFGRAQRLQAIRTRRGHGLNYFDMIKRKREDWFK